MHWSSGGCRCCGDIVGLPTCGDGCYLREDKLLLRLMMMEASGRHGELSVFEGIDELANGPIAIP